MHRFALVQAVR